MAKRKRKLPVLFNRNALAIARNNARCVRAVRRGFKLGKIKVSDYVDRISNLPSDLRFEILSFLPIEQACRASLLSKDWKEAWEFSNQLHISEMGFLGLNRHQDYMDQFLPRLRAPNLDSFSFAFTRADVYHNQVRRLIIFAINRRPKTVSLNFSDPNDARRPSYPLPDVFYDQPSLETLSLGNCALDTGQFRKFTSLKCLTLSHISLGENGAVLEEILGACETIETLILQNVRVLFDITIKSTNLTSLMIEDCRVFAFELYTPNLIFFKYHGTELLLQPGMIDETFVFNIMSPVRKVDIKFVGIPCNDRRIVGDIAHKLLTDLRAEMRTLTICSFTSQALSKGDRMANVLHLGVTELTIKTAFHDEEFEGIIVLLRSCPNLERLTLIIEKENVCTTYLPPLHPISHELNFPCVRSTLKEVSVHGYKGSFMEDFLLKYMIKKGKKMQQLLICGHSKPVHRKRAHRLRRFRKGSPNLCITVE